MVQKHLSAFQNNPYNLEGELYILALWQDSMFDAFFTVFSDIIFWLRPPNFSTFHYLSRYPRFSEMIRSIQLIGSEKKYQTYTHW